MYFPELAWHNIREFLYGKRPFGFWDWKSSISNVLKEIKYEYYPCYYWSSSEQCHYKDNGALDYKIYKILTYGPKQENWKMSIKPTKYIFKNKNYSEEFKRTLWWWNTRCPTIKNI
jgi:hypothetical protein